MNKNIFISIAFSLIGLFAMADGIVTNTTNSPKSYTSDNEDFLLPSGYFNINYNLGFTSGRMSDFIKDNSYRGFNIDGRKFISNNFTVGGYMGWTGFYQKYPRKTFINENGSITGVASSTYYNFNMGVNAHYYPFPSGRIKPYAGVNLGPVYQTLAVQVGRYYIEDKNWQFQFAPELGVFIPFGPDSDAGVNTGIRYNLISYQNTNFGFDNGLSYFQWFLGLSFEY